MDWVDTNSAAALQASEAQLKAETEALQRLNEAGSRLWRIRDLKSGLQEILKAMMELTRSEMGLVQTAASDGSLVIAAHSGISAALVGHLGRVTMDGPSVCAHALRTRTRVIVEDIQLDPEFAPLRELSEEAGVRSIQATPLMGRHGQLLGMISTFRRVPNRPTERELRRLDLYVQQACDFIERCRLEHRSRIIEERTQAFLNHSAMVAWLKNEDGRYLFVSPNFEKQFGWVETDWRGKSDLEIWPNGAGAMYVESDRAALERGVVEVEEYTPNSDGSESWWLTSKYSYSNETGARFVAGVAVDITERKRVERKLRDSDDRNRKLLEALVDGVFVAQDYRFVFVNPAMNAMLGHDVQGAPFSAVIAPDSLDLWTERFAARVSEASEPAQRYEVRLIRRDCVEPFEAELSARRISYQGRPAVLGVLRDISELKRAHAVLQQSEEALRAADRRKDEFIATLAHELRNPLAAIRASIHVLRHANGRLDAEKLLGVVDRQSGQLTRIVDDLIEVSRITRGKADLRKERVDLLAILRDAFDNGVAALNARPYSKSFSAPPDALFVDGDPVRLSQIFCNILNNAAKYTPEGGAIEVFVEQSGEEAVVAIRDSGVGIPADMLSRVFELFTQVDRNLGRAQGGIGIGLALAHDLVKQHGGSIEARSAGIDRGSEFIVRLPLCACSLECDVGGT